MRRLILLLIVVTASCATKPSRIPQIIAHYNLQEKTVSGGDYEHKIYNNSTSAGDYVHVYIPGDGLPWIHGMIIASDPTSRNSLVLHMLGQDTNPALFLGRPCYYGLSESRNCNSDVWTFARYSENVVSSMSTALNRELKSYYPQKKVIIFGFSGGGALAVLMAARIPNTVAVVTVAGALNTDLWVKEHHYLAMNSSLNPYDMERFPEDILQFHLAGGKDDNVTAEITESYVERHGGEIWRYPNYSHGCCWLDIWPGVLQAVHDRLP